MSYRNAVSLALLLLASIFLMGCARTFAGFDGNINHNFDEKDLDEYEYKYFSIDSNPPGAIVTIKGIYKFDYLFKAGVDVEESQSQIVESEWTTIGNAPIMNHRIFTSGNGIDRKIGSSLRFDISLQKVTVKAEKPGYETVEIENVALSRDKTDSKTLVVELLAKQSQAHAGNP